MKKIFILFFCCLAFNTANASIKGGGVHFDNNKEFLSAFENCIPYTPKTVNPEKLARNDIPEEYESIEIIGKQKDMCVFDLIMQMSSKRAYFKMVKRCKITAEQQKKLLKAIKNVHKNKGKEYMTETATIMNQCKIIDDVSIEY